MRFIKHLLASIFLLNAVSHAGPLIVGNGAGQSEFSVVFAREHMSDFYENCSAACGLSAGEAKSLASIVVESKKQINFLFKNSSELGFNLFVNKDGVVWINQDLLWLDTDKSEPFDISAAAAMWTDVFNTSGQSVETLKQKLVSLLRSDLKITRLTIDPQNEFSALLWKKTTDTSDQLILNDSSGQTLDVTNSIHQSIGTDRVHFGRLRWAPIESATAETLRVEFGATYLDRSGKQTRATIDLVISLRNRNGRLSLVPSSLDITVSEE